ncbi:Fe(3+) ABC transporter substrate-binding protein [Azospirillum argentinense]|uniref:Fe(3+) ABC transporter substrate-binding protein n=1 Tax=Azospirillum argentinense TaxID=2970906 RepID=A0A4D8P942_9PROT|nr:Fe(3+) ABC transporter substrate-binding protein [Azospirillum argentinense]QCN95186.1 Fe(3+) ABC transporter substrate-binding protein [Azospirillum argentinense]
MHIGSRGVFAATFAATLLTMTGLASAAEVNVYSARHYDVDKDLYDAFTKKTGIKINVIEGKEEELIERMKTEGGNSPADVFITVDAGRLWRAQEAGLLQPTRSKVMEEAIPAHLREPEGHWFGISKRARILVYNKASVKPGEIKTYEELADPKWKDRVLVRSSTSVYNQSLVGSLLAAHGEKATEDWAKGVVANMARKPQGGDTDQIKGVAANEGDVAVTNTYYFARIASSAKPEDKAIADKLGVIFPNQDGRGTHVNVSGAGVMKNAPNKEQAIQFLEYLVSPEAQKMFTEKNYEYPIVAGAETAPVLVTWGKFKEDPLNAAVYGKNNAEALKIMDRAGWK